MKIKYCTECWGTGKVSDFWDNDKKVICPHCNGTGKEPMMTNEEWRKTCSAEEFAEWMAQYCCDVNTSDVKEILKNEWIEWLNSPHEEK